MSGVVVVLIVLALTAAGCSSPNRGAAESLVAAVASYDVVAHRPARFIVGLYSPDQSQTLAFGAVTFSLNYLGDGEQTDPFDPPAISPVEAVFLPIPGQELDPNAAGPTLVAGSVATGVYAAPDVEFDRPGFWEVVVAAEVDGRTETTTGAFEVLDSSDIPTVGDSAPRTRQPLAGDPTVDPKSIDSRAGGDTPIPDPELHDITVADAIAAGRPVMVVVSTPTFCVSRFCGPITDSVHQLTLEYGDRMEFIHLEVWQDFAGNELNPAAVEWIAPTPETDGGEPWVFVIDADGTIVERFDNVASDVELLTAVESVLNSGDG
ncbi:MAG: hypothetical protein J5I28_03340 [Acidimicrobiales bacterium]|nr:hypothetical protein [Acidimicrobiales bacterium]